MPRPPIPGSLVALAALGLFAAAVGLAQDEEATVAASTEAGGTEVDIAESRRAS